MADNDMNIIGVRDLSRNTRELLDAVAEDQTPRLISRHGKPVAMLVPVDPEQIRSAVLSTAPELVASKQRADDEIAEGGLVDIDEFARELEAEQGPSGVVPPPTMEAPTQTGQTRSGVTNREWGGLGRLRDWIERLGGMEGLSTALASRHSELDERLGALSEPVRSQMQAYFDASVAQAIAAQVERFDGLERQVETVLAEQGPDAAGAVVKVATDIYFGSITTRRYEVNPITLRLGETVKDQSQSQS